MLYNSFKKKKVVLQKLCHMFFFNKGKTYATRSNRGGTSSMHFYFYFYKFYTSIHACTYFLPYKLKLQLKVFIVLTELGGYNLKHRSVALKLIKLTSKRRGPFHCSNSIARDGC